MQEAMNIGEVSVRSGVPAKMIRYYEETGLIRAPARSASGYRRYGEIDVHTLRFVRRARELGFPTARIRQLLRLWSDRRRSSRDVKKIALLQVASLDADIARLAQMRDLIAGLAERCHGDERPHCPILDDLEAGGAVRRRA
jgi:MerR family copper efflux transcriptional regulator